MKKAPLPDSINPRRLAIANASIHGERSVAHMPRLCDALHTERGTMAVSMTFAQDGQGRTQVFGQVSGALELTCELCLEPVSVSIDQSFEWLVVLSETQAEAEIKEHDPVIAADDILDLSASLQDEILLALPIAPQHSAEEPCTGHSKLRQLAPKSEAVGQTSPFADLDGLLHQPVPLKRHQD